MCVCVCVYIYVCIYTLYTHVIYIYTHKYLYADKLNSKSNSVRQPGLQVFTEPFTLVWPNPVRRTRSEQMYAQCRTSSI